MHSPPSQFLPIRGNLGGNWRALLPACHQRRLLLQVRSSQILLLRGEGEADADHVAEAYADADEEDPLFQCKPPQPNPIMHLPLWRKGAVASW